MPDPGPPASSPSAASDSPGNSRGAAFLARLGSTLVLWAVVTAGVILHWNWLFFLLIAALALRALVEFLDLFDMREGAARYRYWTLTVGAVYLLALFYTESQAIRPPGGGGPEVLFIVLHLFGLFGVALSRPLDKKRTLEQILAGFFGFVYAVVLFGFLVKVLYGPGPSGIWYALYVLAVTKFTDAGAYAVGSLFGRHKMIPHISPGKTWEGLAGGFLGAYTAGLALFFAFRDTFALFDLHDALLLPLVLGVGAVIGDLAESILKRCAEKKDSGHMLPGIGGALDLIDSLCFTGPLFYFYLSYVAGMPPEG